MEAGDVVQVEARSVAPQWTTSMVGDAQADVDEMMLLGGRF